MAGSTPPNFREKRVVLYGEKTSEADRIRTAREFFDAERFGETLELLERATDDGLLSHVTDEAVRRGDTFLLLRVEKIRGREFEPSLWRQVAHHAEGTGRFLDAHRAWTRAGDPERASSLRSTEVPPREPIAPEGQEL
jgi:hypothetical protein